MGAPPAFNPPRQQSSNKVWMWLLIVVAALCVVCGIGGYFMVKSAMGMGIGMLTCSMNGEMAKNAVLAYALEHEGRLPAAATWQDDVRPYYERLYNKTVDEMDMKEMPEWLDFKVAAPGQVLECELGGHRTGFALNVAVAGKILSEIADKTTVLIFETKTPAYNASGDPTTRDPEDPILKMWGDKRNWLDFPIEGQPDLFDSSNEEFDFDMKPEDALPEKGGATTGTSNPTGA